MHDILPGQTPLWQWLEGRVRSVFSSYDFHEIRVPMLESTDLFTRAIGQTTDVGRKGNVCIRAIAMATR